MLFLSYGLTKRILHMQYTLFYQELGFSIKHDYMI